MGELCAQCGVPVEHPVEHRYCDSCFGKWETDQMRHIRGEMTKEEYMEKKWK